MQSFVVYHIKCKDCNAEYIGKTRRVLSIRIKEHKEKMESKVRQHIAQTSHSIDFDNVKILDRADTDCKLLVKEVLHIDKRKPTLNVQHSNDDYGIDCLIFGQRKRPVVKKWRYFLFYFDLRFFVISLQNSRST